ncbi:D-lactate dehydrogenase [Psychrobacter pygoscelis]|uniref:D-lactate dehydrogenase n=1 Tax=Psychrobacter pygoscelis TaxID=2488563 RepID=UPI00103AC006|nr:D-lactate dehydrogenase [Psychrobacter pygoscelis]
MSSYDPSSYLLTELSQVVDKAGLLTTSSQQQAYVEGIVSSPEQPNVLAVVIPQTLVALWQVINICAKADAIIIAQAANTGLTGGSTPFGGYDRPVVVISMQRLGGVHLLKEGREVVALPAATLQELEITLAPLGREPHSVLGSSCVGASVIGGICNNSGGMLVQRGPAYTEMALFARRTASGSFELINHLDIALGDSPEEILTRLESGNFSTDQVSDTCNRAASNTQYKDKVRDCNASTPARFNNDPSGLYEASGSAGRLIVFAVRVATFAKSQREQTFYYSSNDAHALTSLRRHWLASELDLPVCAEYMHRAYNEVTLQYGRDTCFSMRKLPAKRIGALYRLQSRLGYYLTKWRLPTSLPDRILQLVSSVMPAALPKHLAKQALAYDYHLIIKVADDNIAPAQAFLQAHNEQHQSRLHTCTTEEAEKLLVFRSAATAAMFRYHNLNSADFGEMISTDIALPRNAIDWDETLPESLKKHIKKTFYLGHFFCHVMHQDYLLQPTTNKNKIKDELLAFYDQRGVEYPAEHNVGHIYPAKPALSTFYRTLDPTNSLNPGIGQTAKWKDWRFSPLMEEVND